RARGAGGGADRGPRAPSGCHHIGARMNPGTGSGYRAACHAASLNARSAGAAATAGERLGRRIVPARSAPPPASAASTTNETRKPWVSVAALTVRPVAVVAIVVTTASPIAPPTCRLVLTSPEATPASVPGTPCRAAIVTATNATPIPIPIRRKDGRRSVR